MRCKKLQPIIPFKGNYEGENPYLTKSIYAFNAPAVSARHVAYNEKVEEHLLTFNSITEEQKDTFERFGGILEEINGFAVTQIFIRTMGEVSEFEPNINLYNPKIDNGRILNVYLSEISDSYFTYYLKQPIHAGFTDYHKFIALFELSEFRISILILSRLEKYISDNLKFKETLMGYQNLFNGSENEFLDFLIYNETLDSFKGKDFMSFFSLFSKDFHNVKMKLTKIKNQLNQEIDLVNTTPEPPQQQNDLENKKLTLTGDKVAIYHVFKQLIAKHIIAENAKEVAEFLIRNVTGFENSNIGNLATEITRDRETDLQNGRIGISKKNKIDLD